MVEGEDAVEVVDLVLEDAGEEARRFQASGSTIEGQVVDGDRPMAVA